MNRLTRSILLTAAVALAGCQTTPTAPKADGITEAGHYASDHLANDKSMADILADLEKRTR